SKLFLKERRDCTGKSLRRAWLRDLRLLQLRNEHLRSFLRRFVISSLYQRNVIYARRPSAENLPGFQVLYKWIKAAVLRDDMKVGCRVFLRQLTNIESNVKIESIGSVTCNLDVLGSASQALQGRCQLERNFRLIGTNEHHDFEVVRLKHCQGQRSNVFEIYQDEVHSHALSLAKSATGHGRVDAFLARRVDGLSCTTSHFITATRQETPSLGGGNHNQGAGA